MSNNRKRFIPRSAKVLAGLALGLTMSLSWGEDAAPAAAAAPAASTDSPLAVKMGPETAHRLVNKWCSACHGYNGRSVAPTFPMLAGQQAEYIENQLHNFHNLNQDDRTVTHETMFEQWMINITGLRSSERYDDAPRNEFRAWDFMKGVARDMDGPTMKALSVYFAKQPALPGRPAKVGNVELGKKLFAEGDADRGVLPCQMCHGPDGHGQGSIPRLAGQHADYVKLQLKYIQSGTRQVDQMAAILANLKDEDFEAVAAYVQSLD